MLSLEARLICQHDCFIFIPISIQGTGDARNVRKPKLAQIWEALSTNSNNQSVIRDPP